MLSRDKESVSRYQQVAEDIRSRIVEGTLAPGSKLAPISELCRRYEVSHITIRSALRELTLSGFVRTEPRLGVFVRDPAARAENRSSLKTAVQPQALLLRNDYPSRRGEMVGRALYRELLDRGYRVLVLSYSDEAQLCDSLAHAPRADALVTQIPPDGYVSTELLRFVKQRADYVVFEGHAPHLMDVDGVVEDPLGCVSLAVRHLWELGHRRIVFLTGEPEFLSGNATRAFGAVTAALEPCGGVFESLVSSTLPGMSALAAMRESLAERISRGDFCCTGAIAYSHVSALGALQALEAAGLQVPRDIGLAVIDHTDLSQEGAQCLTMVGSSSAEMAALIAERIDDKFGQTGPPYHTLYAQPQLVQGGSTRRLAAL